MENKIFYGWWIVGALIVIAAYVQGIVAYGFTAIIEPIADEFNWSYARISLAASIRGFEVGLIAPIIGILLDRLGLRKLLFAGVFIIGLGLILLSRLTSLLMFFGIFALISIGMSTCTGVIPMTVVGNWFKKKYPLQRDLSSAALQSGGYWFPLSPF